MYLIVEHKPYSFADDGKTEVFMKLSKHEMLMLIKYFKTAKFDEPICFRDENRRIFIEVDESE